MFAVRFNVKYGTRLRIRMQPSFWLFKDLCIHCIHALTTNFAIRYVTLVNAWQIERKRKTFIDYHTNKIFLLDSDYKNTLKELSLNKLRLWQSEYIYYGLGSGKKIILICLCSPQLVFVSLSIAFYCYKQKDEAAYFSALSESKISLQNYLECDLWSGIWNPLKEAVVCCAQCIILHIFNYVVVRWRKVLVLFSQTRETIPERF